MISEVNESHFFNIETRMRISPIQSGTSRQEENFLTLDLRLRDEIEKNIIQSRSSRGDRDLLSSGSLWSGTGRYMINLGQ